MIFGIRFYQFIVILIAVAFIAFVANRVRYNKSTVPTLILSILMWLVIIFFAFAPRMSDPLAGYFGLSRGLDLLLIFGLFLTLYAIFRLYMHIESLENQLTDLVRELAVANEIIAKYEDDNKSDNKDIKD